MTVSGSRGKTELVNEGAEAGHPGPGARASAAGPAAEADCRRRRPFHDNRFELLCDAEPAVRPAHLQSADSAP